MFAPLSDAELLRNADLIALGEWLGQTQLQLEPRARPIEMGVLRIDELWRGPAAMQLALVQAESATGLRSSSAQSFKRGDRGLWLLPLVQGTQGLYRSDHPQRFVPSTDQARISALRGLWQRSAAPAKP